LTRYEGFLENPDLQALCTIYFDFEDSSRGIHLSFSLFLWVVFIPWTDYILFKSFLLRYVFFVGCRLKHKTICFVNALFFSIIWGAITSKTLLGWSSTTWWPLLQWAYTHLRKEKGVHASSCSISPLNHNLLHLVWEE
jgi:hypothetical protein